jgi:hypothetical protein
MAQLRTGLGIQSARVHHLVGIPMPMTPDSSEMIARGYELAAGRNEGRSTIY